ATGHVAEDGALVLATPLGEVREAAPSAWQEIGGRREAVAIGYQIVSAFDDEAAVAESEVGFALGAYDPNRPLVIDPVLSYASFIGGNNADTGNSIAVD